MNKKHKDNAPPVIVPKGSMGIAILTVVLLAIGWVVGHRMAVIPFEQALRGKIEREFEREFKRKISGELFSTQGFAKISQTNELIHKLKFQPKEVLEQACNEQVFSNIYQLSSFKTNELLEQRTIEYELWKSLNLLEITSAEEFQLRFNSSDLYDKCRSYFVNQIDGQEHYSHLLDLANNALRDTDMYRELETKRRELKSKRNSGE